MIELGIGDPLDRTFPGRCRSALMVMRMLIGHPRMTVVRGLGGRRRSAPRKSDEAKTPRAVTMARGVLDKKTVERQKIPEMNRPIRNTGWATHSARTCIRRLHELHKFLFGLIHHLGGDFCEPAFLGDSLNFPAGHWTNEVRNVIHALFGIFSPGNAVGRIGF